MKAAIINISDKIGGAAIAGYRIAKAMEKYHGLKTIFLVRSKSLTQNNIFATTPNAFWAKMERLFNIFMNALGLQYVYLPISPYFILRKVRKEQPDIIHLHNPVGGFFMTHHLIKLSGVSPIIWTLHDMWAFTANGAHTFEDDSWKHLKSTRNETKIYPHIGLNTGSWLIKRKKRIYQKSDLTIVAPSQWLYNLAKQSPVFEGKKINYIPHGIDLDKFKPQDKKSLRNKFNLPENGKVLIFIAQKIKNNQFKGGKDLSIILKKINTMTQTEIQVLLMGDNNALDLSGLDNIKVHPLGYIKDEGRICEALNVADVFLYPTRADNLPLVLIEAIASGTPSVTFDIGGCGDMIKDNYNGFLVKKLNLTEAAEKTLYLLNNKNIQEEFSRNARCYAEEKFSDQKMANEYYKLYQDVIKERSKTKAVQ